MSSAIDMTTPPQVIIRSMLPSDASAVYTVQALCYPPRLLETEEIFVSKIEYYASGCFVAEDVVTRSVVGYDGVKMELHNSSMDISHPPDMYYVHDTAVLEQYRSLNLGTKLYGKALERCRSSQFTKLKLVSLPQAIEYWKRKGFKQDHEDNGQSTTYGEVYPMYLLLLPSKHLSDSL